MMNGVTIRRVFTTAVLGVLALFLLGTGTPQAAQVKLKMLFWTFQPQTVQGFIDEFMKRNPDIEVELDGAPSSEYNAKAALMFRSGAEFDVMYIRDATLPQWVENEWVQPIDSCAGMDAIKKEVLPLAMQSQSYKGKLYGLTYYSGIYPIIINGRMMKEAGFNNPPTTFDELVEQARAVKDKGIAEYPFVWPIKPYGWGSMYVWATMTAAKGGKVFDDKFQVTPEGLWTLKWWRKTFDDGLSNPANIEWNNGDAANVFSEGKAFIQWSLNIYIGNAFANHKEKSKVRGQAMLIKPVETGKTVGFTAMYGIHAKTRHKDAACKLVTFLGAKDRSGGYLTPKAWVEAAALTWGMRGVEKDSEVRASIASWGGDPDQLASYVDDAVHLGEVVPYQQLWYFEWQEYADKLLQEILAGRLDPEAGVKQMTERAERLNRRYSR
jgi:multiple sugar transport system substrate-binding protein